MWIPTQNELVVSDKPHTWSYCGQCQTWMIICGYCGNNCCNGGSGDECRATGHNCKEAYDLQDRYWADEHKGYKP